MSPSKSKAETLGMPHGTANNRLRKSIMFKYVVLAGDNFCFKCGAEIESIDDISIEHKVPWEGVSADLFFDLDNISFSHIKCNRPHRNGAIKLRKEGPENTSWCRTCKEYLPLECFWKDARRWDGFDSTCKQCNNARREKTRPRKT